MMSLTISFDGCKHDMPLDTFTTLDMNVKDNIREHDPSCSASSC